MFARTVSPPDVFSHGQLKELYHILDQFQDVAKGAHGTILFIEFIMKCT